MNRRNGCGWAALSLAVLLGCDRPPQVSPQNRHLVESLSTAVSARRNDWLASNSQLIEERRSKAQLSEPEYAALRAIVDKAKAGDWAGARADVIRLGRAQRPTSDEVERLKAGEAKRH